MEYLNFRRLVLTRVCSNRKTSNDDLKAAQGGLEELQILAAFPDVLKAAEEQKQKANREESVAAKVREVGQEISPANRRW